MKVAVAIASHGPRPLDQVLRSLPEHWYKVVVLSRGDKMPEGPYTYTVTHPNRPVGAKWQSAVEECWGLNPDALVICGSDDQLSIDTAKLPEALEKADMIGPSFLTIQDRGRLYKVSYRDPMAQPMGAGRIYTRRALDLLDWHLFDTKRNSALDRFAWSRMRKLAMRIEHRDDIITLHALRGRWSVMHPLATYRNNPRFKVEKIT